MLERKHEDFMMTPWGLMLNPFSLKFLKDSFWVKKQDRSQFPSVGSSSWLPRPGVFGAIVSCLLYSHAYSLKQLPYL